MPFPETTTVQERLRFVIAWERLRDQRSFGSLCLEFGVSRPTGYRWVARWEAGDVSDMEDRSHAAHHVANRTAPDVEAAVVAERLKHRLWGARKLLPPEEAPQELRERWPAPSTIGLILERHGLVERRRRRRRTPAGDAPPIPQVTGPNQELAMDFKGHRQTADGSRCLPFTMIDQWSRYWMVARHLPAASTACVWSALLQAFEEYGLPERIRSDNGTPFASTGAGGLSVLSIRCIQLGIEPVRTRPGHPQDNGRIERGHRTLEQATLNPPAADLTSQQARFDAFVHEYNHERPHEALGQQPPARFYHPSPRRLGPLRPPEYAADAAVRMVRQAGTIKWQGGLVYLSKLLAGQPVGLMEEKDGIGCWYGPVRLGIVDAGKEVLIRPR